MELGASRSSLQHPKTTHRPKFGGNIAGRKEPRTILGLWGAYGGPTFLVLGNIGYGLGVSESSYFSVQFAWMRSRTFQSC